MTETTGAADQARAQADRGERFDRSERGERLDHSHRGERLDHSHRGERLDRSERGDQGERTDRGERTDQGERGAPREFRLAGPGGVEIYRAADIELPEFPLDRRSGANAETPRESLRSFQPERAGLPATSLDEAPGYIQEHAPERRWLRPAEQGPAELQRLYTALDKGGGHAAERHGSEVTPTELRARVTRLEDPAQQDPAERARSQDAFNGKKHRCAPEATQIWDGDAFATAFARGVEHPLVRARLDQPFDPDRKLRPARVPIEDLLGERGHDYCSGYRLVETEGGIGEALAQRKEWVDARRSGREPQGPEPRCVPIESFEGGRIRFVFGQNAARDGYEVVSMFPDPPAGLEEAAE